MLLILLRHVTDIVISNHDLPIHTVSYRLRYLHLVSIGLCIYNIIGPYYIFVFAPVFYRALYYKVK